MIITLTRLIRDLRRHKGVGLGAIFSVVVVSVMGNAITFYLFDGGATGGPGIGDAFWYSIISITTIGYGEFAAESLGARIGTAVFIVIIGLAAFTTAIGMGVDWILELQYKERSGMGSPRVNDHLLIVNFPNERRVRQIIAEFLHDPNHRKREVVIVTDQLESLPFSLPRVHFVRGSVLEEETYQRANVSQAHLAIVLSIGYDVSSSDSVAASVVSILEHMNPEACLRGRVSELGPHRALQRLQKRVPGLHLPDVQQPHRPGGPGPGSQHARPRHYQQPDTRDSHQHRGRGQLGRLPGVWCRRKEATGPRAEPCGRNQG